MDKAWWKEFWKLVREQWVDIAIGVATMVLMLTAIRILAKLLWNN